MPFANSHVGCACGYQLASSHKASPIGAHVHSTYHDLGRTFRVTDGCFSTTPVLTGHTFP